MPLVTSFKFLFTDTNRITVTAKQPNHGVGDVNFDTSRNPSRVQCSEITAFIIQFGYRSLDSIGGIVTSYGLDGLEFESWWGQDTVSSPKSSVLALEPTQPLIQGLPGFLLAGKAVRA